MGKAAAEMGGLCEVGFEQMGEGERWKGCNEQWGAM